MPAKLSWLASKALAAPILLAPLMSVKRSLYWSGVEVI